MMSWLSRSKLIVLAAGIAVVTIWLAMSNHYALPAWAAPGEAARVILSPVYAHLYRADLRQIDTIVRRYNVGPSDLQNTSPLDSWRSIEQAGAGITLLSAEPHPVTRGSIPFVYENPDVAYLKELRDRYQLRNLVKDASNEYEAMLALGSWIGTRWDHGTDPVVGTTQVCDPSDVIAAGAAGAKYWCEIAARTTAHTFMSLGWSARVITASRDGYTWEHAIAELWSNQFNKWFLLDTDFNVVFERAGVPLSAFELMRDGENLQKSGELIVRKIAPAKPSLPYKDLIPFFRYIHLDLRNDWCSRHLRAGSPAGGDLATWWTARPDMPQLLTAKIRVDDQAVFDWKVNNISIHALGAKRVGGGNTELQLGMTAYSPTFSALEWSVDGADWEAINSFTPTLVLPTGRHEVRARVRTKSGYSGPVSTVGFQLY